MAYIVKDLSNVQKIEYKGYTIQLYCIKDSFWSGKREYQVSICISDLMYYNVVKYIRDIRMREQLNSSLFVSIPKRPLVDVNRKTIDRVKQLVPFYKTFSINVSRKYTVLVENRPYVLDAISQIKSIIDTKYGEAIKQFSINTLDLLL